MNHQKMFDDVWNGLKSQNFNRSVEGKTGDCLYRGDNNMKCAAGHIIPDELYDSEMESISFFIGAWFDQVPKKIQLKLKEYFKEKYDISFDDEFHSDWYEFTNQVNVLQGIHDKSYFPQVMREKLEEYAADHQLIIPN